MPTSTVCSRHGAETRLKCVSCGQPICIRCQVRTEVGLKCEDCAALPERARVRRHRVSGTVLMAGGAAVIVAFAAVLVGQSLFRRQASAVPTAAPAGHWTKAADLSGIRGAPAAVVLRDGRVLIAGGGVGSIPLAAAELYDSTQARATPAGPLGHARRGHSMVLLDDGRVMAAGGIAQGQVLSSVELFDPATGAWTDAPAMRESRFEFALVKLADGRVLAAGGASIGPQGGVASLATAEVFDPQRAGWAAAGSMLTARSNLLSARLADGRVLVAGGSTGQGRDTAEAEIFDPAVALFTRASAMARPRQDASATALADGAVLIAGGSDGDSSVGTAEIFRPADGSWSAAGTLHQSRRLQGASLLSNGRVLVSGGEQVAGGVRTSLRSAELFDPVRRRWEQAAAMSCPRSGLVQLTMRDGSAIAVGGDAAFPGQPPAAQSCVEVYRN